MEERLYRDRSGRRVVENMGETGKSFRESWSQRLTDADTVTESDVISLYQDLRPEIAAREDGDKRLVLDHATSDVAANLMIAARDAPTRRDRLRRAASRA